jgi:hypothetical protein
VLGRDLTKYLPGLYWFNVLSQSSAEHFGIEDQHLPARPTLSDFGSKHLAFRLFERPEDWPRYANQIDTFCERSSKIFSLRRIQGELGKAKNFLELMRLIGGMGHV